MMQLPYFCNMRFCFGFFFLILSVNCTKDLLSHHSLTHPDLGQKAFGLSLESRPRPGKNELAKNFLHADKGLGTKFFSKTHLQWTLDKIWSYRIFCFWVKVEKLITIQLSLWKKAQELLQTSDSKVFFFVISFG